MEQRGHRPSGQAGSATLEFALVLPLVLIMALALLQVGLLVKDELVVEEAARAGAREASVTADDGVVRTAATRAAGTLDPRLLTIDVGRDGGVGDPVTVRVRYAAPISVPVVAWLFPSRVALSGDATMRQETG